MQFRHMGMILMAALLLFAVVAGAQKDDKEKSGKADKEAGTVKLRIEVTGGDKNVPVVNASVYVRYYLHNSKKLTELDLKTNHEGVTRSPEIPAEKVLVQVVAEGWKTFGRWYDVNEGEQTVKIHLEKPPKWY